MGIVQEFMDRARSNPKLRDNMDNGRLAMQLGKMVYDMRKSRDLSQDALAEAIRVKQSHISRLERGNQGHVPSLALISKAAEACGYDLTIEAVPHEERPTPVMSVGEDSLSLREHVEIVVAASHD